MATESAKPPQSDIPRESVLLRAAYERSGLSVGAMAKAVGLSSAAIHIAMNGFRYRGGEPVVVSPPDSTVVKLASLLRVEPGLLRDTERPRAAQLLEEVIASDATQATVGDREAQTLAAGRMGLARPILAAFSTDELRAEIERRDEDDAERQDAESLKELADELRAAQYPD